MLLEPSLEGDMLHFLLNYLPIKFISIAESNNNIIPNHCSGAALMFHISSLHPTIALHLELNCDEFTSRSYFPHAIYKSIQPYKLLPSPDEMKMKNC